MRSNINKEKNGANASKTIMFVDISGSTRLYDELGNTAARQKIDHCLSIIKDIAVRFFGTLVKEIGDEVVCTFHSPDVAFIASCEMQRTVSEDTNKQKSALPAYKPLHIRIGFHHGEVILESGDVFGESVNITARVTELATSGKILTTGSTVGLLGMPLRDATRCIDSVMFKGMHQETRIYEVIWQRGAALDELTIMRDDLASITNKTVSLKLKYKHQEVIVNKQKPNVTLGRSIQNMINVNNELASRIHARIECQGGRFILIDQSTNGTYIRHVEPGSQDKFTDEKESCLRRNEAELTDAGVISLGCGIDTASDNKIYYSIIYDD